MMYKLVQLMATAPTLFPPPKKITFPYKIGNINN